MTEEKAEIMRGIQGRIAGILLAILAVAVLSAGACGGDDAKLERIRIVALTPQTATASAALDVTVSLQRAGEPFESNVTVEMLRHGTEVPVLKHRDRVNGTKNITLVMPSDPGTYRIRFSGTDGKGNTFDESGTIKLENTSFVILQTDKPTYQPGHELKMRAIVMNRELKPVAGSVTFSVHDAKGASVHQERVRTGAYGMASSSIPISPEPRTGMWTVTATASGQRDTQEVLVDHYVLPRYRVEVIPSKTAVGSGDPVEGIVRTEYTYGISAKGTLSVVPMYREKGKTNWVEGGFENTRTTGEYEYSFDTAEKWTGEVRVEVRFRENSQDEGTTAEGLHRVSETQGNLEIIPDGNTVRPGLPFRFEIRENEWSERYGEREIRYTLAYTNRQMQDTTVEKDETLIMEQGKAEVRVKVPKDATTLSLMVKDWKDRETRFHLSASHSTTGRYIQLENLDPVKKEPGETVAFRIHSTFDPEAVYWQTISKGRVAATGLTSENEFEIEITGSMSPTVRVVAFVLTEDGELVTAQADMEVTDAFPLRTQVRANPKDPRPGDRVTLSVETDGPSLVSVAGADRATHVLAGSELDMSKLLASLKVSVGRFWDPKSMEKQYRERSNRIVNPGSSQLLANNGMQVISNAEKQAGRTLLGTGGKGQKSWAGRNNTFVVEILTAPWRKALWQGSKGNNLAKESAMIAGVIMIIGTSGTILFIAFRRLKRNAERRAREGTRNNRMAKTFLVVGILALLLAAAAFIMPGIFSRLIVEPAGGQSVSGSYDSYGGGGGTRTVATVESEWAAPESPAKPGEAGPADRIRSEFPETWLWELEYTDSNGRLTLDRTVPDSITSWDIRTIAMSPKHGLGMDETSVRVIQPLFLKANIPPKTIRNETIPLRVTAYNYTREGQNIRVILSAPPEMGLQGVNEQTMFIEGEGNALATFHITPRGTGEFPVMIEARGETHSDAMAVTTVVRAEGVPAERTLNLIIEPGGRETVGRIHPENAVPDTLVTWIEVTGGNMSKPLENLGKMLKIPFGCGEQNMTVVGPNAQILRYLSQRNPEEHQGQVDRATRLMQEGYQRQLIYQRNDGSFSAFGNQDSQGSLWLTAYTLKTFVQSQEFIHIDPKVMQQTVQWITGKQRSDGSFELNARTVHNMELVNGNTGITAYVALALIEAGGGSAAQKAVRYLEENVSEDMNAHTRAVVSLVLAKARSPVAGRSLDILATLEESGSSSTPVWSTAGNSVEPTAYAALAAYQGGRFAESFRAVDTLIQMQSSLGGYQDTHSTALAIEAIATAQAKAEAPDYLVEVTLEGQGWSKRISIDRTNLQEVQRVDLPGDTGAMTASVNGTTRAYVSVINQYNMLPKRDIAAEPMRLDISLDRTELRVGDRTTIQARVEYKESSPANPGMITVEIENPTGTNPVPESLQTLVNGNNRVMRADNENGRTVIYIDWMGPGEVFVLEYQAVAALPVEGRPASAQVYAYYRPGIRTSATLPQVRVTN